jgi:predicted phage terminase large subunit-like protein
MALRAEGCTVDPILIERARNDFEAEREHFAPYCHQVFPRFQEAIHTMRIVELYEAAERGELDRLAISLPPRHGKTQLAILFLSWLLWKHPEWNVVLATYGQQLTRRFGRMIRNIVLDVRHRSIFPESTMSPSAMSVDYFAMEAGGSYLGVGRGGALTGSGCNVLVCDDLLKDHNEAKSETIRSGLHEWLSAVAYTRLEPRPDGHNALMVLQATRWHDQDPIGYCLREHADDGWKEVRMSSTCLDVDAPGEWRTLHAALWPERFNEEALARIRRALKPADWMSLYQQMPVAQGGNVFRTSWLTESPKWTNLNWKNLTRLILVDPASARKRTSDYTVQWCIGLGRDNNVYILDAIRARLSLTERTDALFALWKRYKPIHLVAYERYSSSSDEEHIRYEMDHQGIHFPIIAAGNSQRSADGKLIRLAKVDRIEKLIPWFQNHRIIFPENGIWVREGDKGQDIDLVRVFKEVEYEPFPNGSFDDMLDALSMMLDPKVSLPFPENAEEPRYSNRGLVESVMSEWDENNRGVGRRSWMSH